ncbi:nicotinate phosphoribosyltransferase [Kordiimonas sp. SCSIO 12610]|uniref:nicotinate phosphoribosyltransferase n=1 Tax=Kordiimonas sp. SCSIO 12610 TaxID=2829597 RepID=UPI002109FF71|nr:nicotinate phosphoribosyltransferase [Kordiimonas sp. SCSIO 12610]UTW56115.1 nicotinate phosphoribosyltransferase [Kordiimonas sp. SCSIO 12610]
MANIILDTDSYKHSHYLQYPPNTTMVSSYVESRGGKHPATIFFGLQAWLFKVLKNPVTLSDVDDAAWFCNQHGIPFNRAGWEHIVRQHGGYLPLEIEAAPEGELIPTGNVMLQVRNTDPACYWVTNFVETTLLRAIWYPTTVATNSFYAKKTILKYLAETSDADAEATAQFMLHDFGARGVSSEESAALGGLAHLINFRGTDTMSALVAAKRYYMEPMAGFSVPASEHSTMTSWTKSGEEAAYSNMLERFADSDIISIVADSYDIHNAVETIFGEKLKAKILENAKHGTRLTVRPDSGDPVETPIEIIKLLMEKFGATTNSKGYRVLPDHVRVLQGDGITPDTIGIILGRIKEEGLSAENIVFGMGAGLLQQCNRDTQKFAMKCSAVEVDGEMRDVFKDPVTDKGKTSKRGVLKLIRENGTYKTVRADNAETKMDENYLRPVYRNGQMLITDSFEAIRRRAFKAQ